VVVALLLYGALFADAAHAEDVLAPNGAIAVTSSADESASSDPVSDPTAEPQPSTDSSSPSDVDESAGETSPDSGTTEPSQAAPGDEASSPPDDAAPAPEPVPDPVAPGDASGDATASQPEPPPVTETPPETQPTEPVAEPSIPATIGDPRSSDARLKSPLSGGTGSWVAALDASISRSIDLPVLPVDGAHSTRDRDPRLTGSNSRSTKSQSALRSFSSQPSPASSPSPGASGGSGAGGSAGGVCLAVEFLLTALVVLRYTRRASFTLPDSLAFALREERPD
jgi:hypothetical protein